MQLLQVGKHKVLLLEFDTASLGNIIKKTGFEYRLTDNKRNIIIELSVPEREAPLLLFDASDPGNLGWFSRCTFYVDGATGRVLQTPICIANQIDRAGRALPNALRVQVFKEIPYGFRMPGQQVVTEQVIAMVLCNLLTALLTIGVGVCGGPVVRPLAGRTDGVGIRG